MESSIGPPPREVQPCSALVVTFRSPVSSPRSARSAAASSTRLFDAKTGAECFELPLSDGQGHCVPAWSEYVDGTFADAECTVHAARAFGMCATTPLFAQRWVGADTAKIYAIAGASQAAAYGGNACVAAHLDYEVFPVGAAVAPSRFATMSPASFGDGRLRLPARRVSGAAAPVTLRWDVELHDTALDIACRPARAADGKLRCLPAERDVVALLAGDASCATPATLGAHYGAPPTSAPRFATFVDASTCEPGTRVYAGTNVAAVPVDGWALDAQGRCAPSAGPGLVDGAAVELDPAMFAEVRLTTELRAP